MAFLENFGKKVGEAAQAAARKSGDLVESTKLSVNINSEEDKIQKLYAQIGKIIYTKYSAGGTADPDIQDSCEAVKVHEQNIKNLKEKLMELKGTKICVSCGAEMDRNQLFCAKCGARNEIVPASEAAPEEQAKPTVCPACGAQLEQGSQFCASCGTKIG